MAEVYVFDAKLESHVDRPVTRRLALASRQTLIDLHGLIQEAFEWDDDHLYSFWLDGKFWGDTQTEYTAPFGLEESDTASADVELGRLGLRKGQRIAYVFDFGDEWRSVGEAARSSRRRRDRHPRAEGRPAASVPGLRRIGPLRCDFPEIPFSGAPVAQWTERRPSKPLVGGSNPPGRTASR